MGAANKIELNHENDPNAIPVKRAMRPLPGGSHGHSDDESNWLVSYADMMTLLLGFFIILQSFSKVDSGSFEKVKQESTKSFGGEYTEPYNELKEKIQKVIDEENLTKKVSITQTDASLDMTFDGQLFFDSGSVELNVEAKNLLAKLVPRIRETASSYYITIEGHTDNRPINVGLIASNWELSGLRATRVLRYFQDTGFSPKHLKSIGWGDTQPLLQNIDEKGQESPLNQAKNRRVLIKVSREHN